MSEERARMEIWPIGSGKGGVGKTLLTANLGILFSRMNKNVVILDADLGASNLHTALGIPHLSTTLNDLITDDVHNLADIAVETRIPGLRLIGGSHQLPAYPNYYELLTERILSSVPQLQADILLVDLGAGISPHVLDLFLLSDQGTMVMTNDPASIQNTYQFLKMAVHRKILKAFPNNPLISYMVHSATHPKSKERINSVSELIDKISRVDQYYGKRIRKILEPFAPKLVINMTDQIGDTRAANVVGSVCKRFVGMTPRLLGTLEYDPGIRESALKLRPFTLYPENRNATEQLTRIALRLLAGTDFVPGEKPLKRKEKEESADPPSRGKDEVWLMDNVEYKNRPLYVLTEKLIAGGAIQTSVYFRGKVLFSKRLTYPELKDAAQSVDLLKNLVRRQHVTALKGIEEGRLGLQDED